ncbi:MAG: hypothetical protein ACRCY7_07605 [Cetobacterium sp.]|uniref:hypothetical protein n=1 Tax=Cetobacterium sp. TaxID=2071632 RepID=UPI003F301608
MSWRCKECCGTDFQIKEVHRIVKYELKFDEDGILQDCEKDEESDECLSCSNCNNYVWCDDIEQIAEWVEDK